MSLPPISPPPSTNKKIRPVISCLLKHREEVLILKRSKHVGSFQGYWSCISGYLEAGEDLINGIPGSFRRNSTSGKYYLETIYAGPFYPEADDVIFETHWFLLETNTKEITLDWEHDECRWVIPEKFSDYQVVSTHPDDHLFAKRSAG